MHVLMIFIIIFVSIAILSTCCLAVAVEESMEEIPVMIGLPSFCTFFVVLIGGWVVFSHVFKLK